MTLVMIVAAVVVLPLEYHSLSATDAWIFVAYVSAFPYLGWTFVPILALHGVLFGRVAWYLESRSQEDRGRGGHAPVRGRGGDDRGDLAEPWGDRVRAFVERRPG